MEGVAGGRWSAMRWSDCGRAEYGEQSCTGMKRTVSGEGRSSGSDMSTKRRKRSGRSAPQFVVCIKNAGHPASLELHKIYRVVPDAGAVRDGDVRVVDESGEDYLYPADWFAVLELPRRVRTSLIRRSA